MKDAALTEIVEGKTVAIVWELRESRNSRFGRLIDAHDVVVRINAANRISDSVSQGTRTTVAVFRQLDAYPFHKDIHPEHDFCVVGVKGQDVTCPRMDVRVIRRLAHKLNKFPTTGMRTIEWVMYHAPAWVSLFGFDIKFSPAFDTEQAYIDQLLATRNMVSFAESHRRSIGARLQGKRVAIVGNAASLFTKQHGRLIDSHDLVVRCNYGHVTKDPLVQGVRTSVLVYNTPHRHKRDVRRARPDYGIVMASPWCRDEPFNQQFDKIPLSLCQQLTVDVQSPLLSVGVLAIGWVLSFHPSQVSLFGFDHKATPTWYNNATCKVEHDWDKEKAYVDRLVSEEKVSRV